jgi:hypothetical protein
MLQKQGRKSTAAGKPSLEMGFNSMEKPRAKFHVHWLPIWPLFGFSPYKENF